MRLMLKHTAPARWRHILTAWSRAAALQIVERWVAGAEAYLAEHDWLGPWVDDSAEGEWRSKAMQGWI